MSDKDLINYIHKWQHKLGLDDWYIVIQLHCRPEEMRVDGYAETEWNETTKCAIIRFIDKKYYPETPFKYDIKETARHELLHIKFAFLTTNDSESLMDRIVHQLIDDLAKAMDNGG